MHPVITTINTASLFVQSKYLALFPASVIAQPATALLAGVLIRVGYLEFLPSFVYIVAGALFGDIAWYVIGYFFGNRFAHRYGRFFGITKEHVDSVSGIFHRYDSRILVVSKVTNGFGLSIVTLFTAGLSRIPLWRFVVFNVIGEALWTGMLIGIGVFFSHLYVIVNNALGRVSIIGMFVLLVIIFIAIGRYVQVRLMQK